MNYLAHIYLSGDQERITVGNFMADSIKGNQYRNFPVGFQKGILLHRQIDWFTDTNDIARRSKRRLHERYGLYRGIIIDIFYDHFLAKNWQRYSSVVLEDYSQGFYEMLRRHFEVLPEKVQYMSKYLIKENWLLSYADLEGIEKVLHGMNRRTGSLSKMNLAMHDLEAHYDHFEKDFKLFFKELSDFSSNKLLEINEMYDNNDFQ